jgi:endoglucanase
MAVATTCARRRPGLRRPVALLGLSLAAALAATDASSGEARSRDACDAAAKSGVPKARLALLARGFNLTGWFDPTPGRRPDEHVLRTLLARGLTHVRLPVDGELLMEGISPRATVEKHLAEIDEAVDSLLRIGFAVSLDMHPGDAFSRIHAREPARALAILEDAWRILARRHAGRDPERLYFEILNEPAIEAPWARQAPRVVAAVRREAPDHTIVVGPGGPQRIEALTALSPVPDRNVVYAIHFYDPMAFTHQGLTWGEEDEPLRHFRDVPFPSSLAHAGVQTLYHRLLREGRTNAAQSLVEQMRKPWNEDAVQEQFARAAEWAVRFGRAVIVNEFGVLRWKVDPQDRERWLRTVRSAAERFCIGWAHWDYADGFGLATRSDGRTIPDPLTLEALLGEAPLTDKAPDEAQRRPR